MPSSQNYLLAWFLFLYLPKPWLCMGSLLASFCLPVLASPEQTRRTGKEKWGQEWGIESYSLRVALLITYDSSRVEEAYIDPFENTWWWSNWYLLDMMCYFYLLMVICFYFFCNDIAWNHSILWIFWECFCWKTNCGCDWMSGRTFRDNLYIQGYYSLFYDKTHPSLIHDETSLGHTDFILVCYLLVQSHLTQLVYFIFLLFYL